MHLVLLPILGLFTIRFYWYGILEVKKNNFPTNQPIPEKQGWVRGNKNIFKVGLKACYFRFRRLRHCTIYVAKTKALISCAVTMQLIWAFVFAYAKSRFS